MTPKDLLELKEPTPQSMNIELKEHANIALSFWFIKSNNTPSLKHRRDAAKQQRKNIFSDSFVKKYKRSYVAR